MFGFIFIERKEILNNVKSTWKTKLLWNLSWLLCLAISILGFPFIELDIQPSIWTAIYGGLMKHFTGFLLGVFVLGLITRVNVIMPKFLNLPVFLILGRISYSYYLCHIFVMKVFMLGTFRPFEISDANVWSETAAIFFFGNILSIPLALIVEFPVTAIGKELVTKFAEPAKSSSSVDMTEISLGSTK